MDTNLAEVAGALFALIVIYIKTKKYDIQREGIQGGSFTQEKDRNCS